MESKELLQLITKGETREIEFKSWIKAKSKEELMGVIAKEVVALANTFGGYFFLELRIMDKSRVVMIMIYKT